MSAVEKVKQKYAEEMAKAQIEDDTRAKLPVLEGLPEPRIFVHRTPNDPGYGYGAWGHIDYKAEYYDVTYNNAPPMKSHSLLTLLQTYERNVPLVMVKDGSTSFRPQTQEWKGEITPVYDIVFEIDPNTYGTGTPRATFYWYTKLGEDMWKISAEFSAHQVQKKLAYVNSNIYRDKGTGTILQIRSCDIVINHNVSGARSLKWGTGSDTTLNRFSIYWDRAAGALTHFPDFIED